MAGVKRLVVVVPCPDGVLNSAVLAAAHIAGVDEIYKIGGAQAVAALAYGTETIKAVDKIVGPGNAYVAEAKRRVFGKVGIDMIAGPSEIMVISDNKSNPAWVAADLLSQAEHDALAQSILITDDSTFASTVEAEIEKILGQLPREKIARASWEQYGVIITTKNLQEACDIANLIAPEHLELMVENPEALAVHITHAGQFLWGAIRPKRLGIILLGQATFCPPRARHVFPQASPCLISSNAPRSFLARHNRLKRCVSTVKCSRTPRGWKRIGCRLPSENHDQPH